MSKCILCGMAEAEVPDRERMGRPIKRLCHPCHQARLKGDVYRILAERHKRESEKE